MTAPQTVADVQHTPGPWTVIALEHRRELRIIAPALAGNEGRETIALIPLPETNPSSRFVGWTAHPANTLSSDDTDANARLMAAAPDLASALKALLAEVDETARRNGWAGHGAREVARAALRAAATSARQGETK